MNDDPESLSRKLKVMKGLWETLFLGGKILLGFAVVVAISAANRGIDVGLLWVLLKIYGAILAMLGVGMAMIRSSERKGYQAIGALSCTVIGCFGFVYTDKFI